jgi:hypothetical protein
MPSSAGYFRAYRIIPCTFAAVPNPASNPLTRDQTGALLDNTGASGPVGVQLPLDGQAGDRFLVDIGAAQTFSIFAGSGGVFVLAGVAQPANKTLSNSTLGESCELLCVGSGSNVGRTLPPNGATWRIRAVIGSHFVVS